MDVSSSSEFVCPRSNVSLQDVRTSGGVFYSCDICGGRAVTIELLRKRFTEESINPLWLHATRGEGCVGLPCPSGQQAMISVPLSDQAEIRVDVAGLAKTERRTSNARMTKASQIRMKSGCHFVFSI
jgi:hypothetical protein